MNVGVVGWKKLRISVTLYIPKTYLLSALPAPTQESDWTPGNKIQTHFLTQNHSFDLGDEDAEEGERRIVQRLWEQGRIFETVPRYEPTIVIAN